MSKKTTNQILLVLTIIIAIGAIVSIISFFQTQGILSDYERAQIFQEDQELPTNTDDDSIVQQVVIQETPLGYQGSTQDQISQFLETIGLSQTETLGIESTVELIDSDRESEIESSFLRVQPLDPRTVIVEPEEGIPPERLFINTDFATQLADNARNFHLFSGWDVIRAGNVGISVTVGQCSGISEHNGKCVIVDGNRDVDDDVTNFSTFYGIVKDIDISDWTTDGELILRFDYGCDSTQGSEIFTTVKGDTENKFNLMCQNFNSFEMDVSQYAGTSDILRVKIGGSALNVDNFRLWNFHVNNVQLEGNSIAIREAVETLEGLDAITQLSLVKDQGGQILDLGFIRIELDAITIQPNERIVLDGVMETRINEQTISTHPITVNSRSDSDGRVELSIDGQDQFIFRMDQENFDEGFNTLKFLINDVVANVGDTPNVRTFEYHRPFVVYILDFNVFPDEIVAFDQENRAISVKVNDSTFTICGLTEGENSNVQPAVFPPQVRIINNGFTIATTNPQAGLAQVTDTLTGEVEPNTEFCSTVPELPRDTQLTFEIDGEFFIVDSPTTQKNFYLKCTRNGCSSNIGYSSV